MKPTMAKLAALALGLAAMHLGVAHAGDLTINNSLSDPASVAALGDRVKKFEAENPSVRVHLNTIEHEAYKTSLRNWLATKAPDVIFWAASERLRAFVRLGLIADISDIWASEGLDRTMAATKVAVTTDDKQYAVPLVGIAWGIYYRKDLFEKAGLQPPKTFEDLVASCRGFRAKGIVPLTIGTKELWPAAAYFDYIDLRLNGLPFHLKLLRGDASFQDPKVRDVFTHWRELIDARCFPDDHAAVSFQDAMPPMINGTAAMYLMGSFIASSLPADVRERIGFTPFPQMREGVPDVEDLTVDTIAIPARAENQADARAFVKFMARAENQTAFDGAIGRLPLNTDSTASDDPLTQATYALAKSATGAAQYFDRDTDPEFAQIAIEQFQRFMVYPDQVDDVVARIAEAQEQIKARQ